MAEKHLTFGLGNLRMDINDLRWIFVLVIFGITWGVKLEFKIDAVQNAMTARIDLAVREHAAMDSRLADVEHKVDAGVLPRTEERLIAIQREALETRTAVEAMRRELADMHASVEALKVTRPR